MAKWLVRRKKSGAAVSVTYVNLYSGERHHCGTRRVTVDEAVGWIVLGKGAAAPGDLILLPGGRALLLLRERGLA